MVAVSVLVMENVHVAKKQMVGVNVDSVEGLVHTLATAVGLSAPPGPLCAVQVREGKESAAPVAELAELGAKVKVVLKLTSELGAPVPPASSWAPSHAPSDEDEDEDLEGEEDDAFEVSLEFGQGALAEGLEEQKIMINKGETVGEVKRRMSVSMGVSEEEMAMLMGLSGADDNMTIEESGILKKGAKIRLPRHSGNVAVQFRGKGKFVPVHLDLREGRLVFSDAKTGTDLRDAKVWGCAVSAPKKARKGHKYILRLDLRAGRVDSRDDSKYVLSTTTGSDLNRWQTDLVAYSVLNEEAAMREDDEHDDGSASAKVPEGVPPQPQQAQKFSEGALIRVVGLVNTPQHNGKSGRITAFDSGQGRYLVLVRCIPHLPPVACLSLPPAQIDEGPGREATRLALLERNLRDGPSAQQTATPPASEVHELRAEMQELRKCEPAATLVGVQTC